jgi:hypothetical protein
LLPRASQANDRGGTFPLGLRNGASQRGGRPDMPRRPEEINEFTTLHTEYRRSLFTILGHSAFFVACCVVAILIRRMLKMPPLLLTAAFVVAVVLFGRDFLHFLSCRRRLKRFLDSAR